MNGDWLLCDFHIHSKFSDGQLTIEQIVDLFGSNGFDAISITDHILDEVSWKDHIERNENPHVIPKKDFEDYLHAAWKQARGAWEKYRMLLIPGAEITNDRKGYHILAIDLKSYIEPNLPVAEIVRRIHAQGAIAVAPHPHRGALDGTQQLMYLWNNRGQFAEIFDAWEVANRDDLFNVIGLNKLNYIANSDFHEEGHLYSWKSLLRSEKNPEAIKDAVRKNDRVSVYLFRRDKQLNADGIHR